MADNTLATENENGANVDTDETAERTQNEEIIMKNTFINFANQKLQVTVRPEEIGVIHKLKKRRDGVEPVLVQLTSNSVKRNTD